MRKGFAVESVCANVGVDIIEHMPKTMDEMTIRRWMAIFEWVMISFDGWIQGAT